MTMIITTIMITDIITIITSMKMANMHMNMKKVMNTIKTMIITTIMKVKNMSMTMKKRMSMSITIMTMITSITIIILRRLMSTPSLTA